MKIEKVTEESTPAFNSFDEDRVMMGFVESALTGSAAAVASRHDFTPEKMAMIALKIARAAIEELKHA